MFGQHKFVQELLDERRREDDFGRKVHRGDVKVEGIILLDVYLPLNRVLFCERRWALASARLLRLSFVQNLFLCNV